MSHSPIENVSDTAFMVAAFRARESERPDALFHDPLAATLAGEEGRLIVDRLPRGLFFSGWTVVVRTRIIDDFIQTAIAAGVDTILNLGAGLDTRPYRMDLPVTLRWIEADYPSLIELKEQRLAAEKPRCALRRFKIDLADDGARREFFANVAAESGSVLILTEGVTPYLTVDVVASLAQDLKRQKKFHYWIADYFSPMTYLYRKRPDIRRTMAKAPFRFQPDDYFGFFAAQGWRLKEIRYIPEEGDRLHRPAPMSWFRKWWVHFVHRFAPPAERDAYRKFSGFSLFESNGTESK